MFRRLYITLGFSVAGIVALLGAALPATQSSASSEPTFELYVVQPGESIQSIAADYQIAPDILARVNKLRVTDALKTGQAVLIPVDLPPVPQPTPATQPSVSGGPVLPAASAAALPKPTSPPSANQVVGYYATVIAKKAEFRTKPNGGEVLCDDIPQGKPVLVTGQNDTHFAVLMSDGSTGWVPRLALQVSDSRMTVDRPAAPAAPVQATGRKDIIATAFEYMGIRYVYGGRLPDSVDCSLLVQTVFRRHGFNLPRTAAQQSQVGSYVDPANLIAGDRLYFYNSRRTTIGHTGIYIGDGRFIHASSNQGKVGVDELSNPRYMRIYAFARR